MPIVLSSCAVTGTAQSHGSPGTEMDHRSSKEKGMGARHALAGRMRRLLRAGANYSAERFTQTKADCEDALWLARQRLAARPLPALAIVLGIGLVAGMVLAHAWAARED